MSVKSVLIYISGINILCKTASNENREITLDKRNISIYNKSVDNFEGDVTMTVDEIISELLIAKGWSKAQLGRTIGVVTQEEAENKPSKATDTINKRMKQKNISIKLLTEMLDELGYTIIVVPKGHKLSNDEYEITV